MATTTPNFGWAVPTSTDLVKDGAVAIETLGDSIDASLVDLKGGTTGQVLAKASGTDMDFTWTTSSAGMTNPMTTTGDTIYSSSGSTPARRAIGTTGQVLTVSGGLPVWATPSGGWAGTYTAYTPVVNQGTTTFGINDGAAYTENGKFVHVIVYFNVSSGTGEANRAIEITLPVAAAGDYTSAGAARLNDASASRLYYGENSMSGSTTKFCLVSGANQIDGRWGRTDSQFAIQMASGDEVWASFVYRKA